MNSNTKPPPPPGRWTVDSIKKTLRSAMDVEAFKQTLSPVTLRLLSVFAPARTRGNVSPSGAVATNTNRARSLLTLIERFRNKLRSFNARIRHDALRDVIFALIANGASPEIDRETLLRRAACNILKRIPPRDLLPLRVFAASLVMLDTLQQQPEQSKHTADLRSRVGTSVNDLLTLIVPEGTRPLVSAVINRLVEVHELSAFINMLYKRKIVKPRNPLSVMILHLEKTRAMASTSMAASRVPTKPRERPDSVAAVVRELQYYVQRTRRRRNAQQPQQRQALTSIPYRTEALIEKLRAPIAQPKRSTSNNAMLRNPNKARYIRLGFDDSVQKFLTRVRERGPSAISKSRANSTRL